MDCRSSLSLAIKKGMVANSNKKRFLNFSVALSIFNPCEHKCIALTFYKKCIIIAETRWAIGPAALLVSYWLEAFSCKYFLFTHPVRNLKTPWEVDRQVSPSIWPFPKMFPYTVKIAHKVFNTLCTFSTGSPISTRCWPKGLKDSNLRAHFSIVST
jgi:hypothetical protein